MGMDQNLQDTILLGGMNEHPKVPAILELGGSLNFLDVHPRHCKWAITCDNHMKSIRSPSPPGPTFSIFWWYLK